MRDVLERVTLSDVAQGAFPIEITRLLDEPGAWHRR